MWFRSLFHSPKHSSRRGSKWPPVRGLRSLVLERLEDLCLPSFLDPVSYPVATASSLVVSGDFNNDGRLDLAISNTANNTISVLKGNAGGTFQPAVSSNAGGGAVSLAMGDFNADGKLDLVAANSTNVSVLLGNGDGTFQPPTTVVPTGPYGTISSVAVGDFNGDGKLDLGVASSYYIPGGWGYYGGYPGWYADTASVLLGNGAGAFATSGSASSTFYGRATAAVADVNNDGKQDLVLGGNSGYVSVHLGDGLGGLGSSLNSYAPQVPTAQSMALGDMDKDGKLDVVVANPYSSGVTVLQGNGLGGFTTDSAHNFATDSYIDAVALADFNGDGKLDVEATSSSGTMNVLLGTGSGTLRPAVIDPVAGGLYAAATGDFNGDGGQDVAPLGGSTVWVLLNDADWPELNAPEITIDNVTVTEGNSGTTNAVLTISLSAPSSKTVTVHYATVDGNATAAGNDYQPTSGVLTFAPGVTSLTVAVPVVGDRLGEGYGEGFSLTLSNPTGAFIARSKGNISILDDEPVAYIDYGPINVTEGNTGTINATFTIHLSVAYDAPVSVNYSTFEGDTDFPYWGYYGYYAAPPSAMAGTDFEAKAGAVTFAPGETVKTVVVAVKGDVSAEDSEYFSLNLTDSPDATLSARHAVAVILDDEPRVSVNDASVKEGNSGTTSMTFTVTLSSPTTVPVTVNYATADGDAQVANGDYQSKTGTLTFAPGETSKTVTVLVTGDRLGEYDESFNLILTSANGAALADAYGWGTILDNEARLSINNASIKEGNNGTKQMTFIVTMAAAYDQTVTVKFSTHDWSTTAGQDYVAKSGTLTFLPGETKKTITITIKGDTKREGDETFMVALENPSSNALVYVGSGWGTIIDDDRPGKKR